MNNRKNKITVWLGIALFGILGIYLIFFRGGIGSYDSKTNAYSISPNESHDTDNNIIYRPTYYFKVDGKNYKCESQIGSSTYPNNKKNTVYYDSSNPNKCKTEYDKSSGLLAGIVCLVAVAIIVYFFVIKKSSNNAMEPIVEQETQVERDPQLDQQKAEKVVEIISLAQLVYKRVVIGIIVAILSFLVLIETVIFIQTIKAKDFIETTAVYVDTKNTDEDSIFNDCIYTFKDKNGNEQEIIISIAKDSGRKSEVKIKYNENDPQDYYEEGATLDKSGIIWYIVKIVVIILLVILFFNKKLLSKVNVSASSRRR